MKVVRALLVAGNQKLSQAIWHWDLPAGTTCPGKSDLCSSRCYAMRGRYKFPQVKERLEWCLQMSKRKDFAQLMVKEIRRRGAAFVVRIHCSGDFPSEEYARKWIRIVKASPNTRFYAYTRSHVVPSIAPALAELAQLENMQLWASADSEMGYPVDLPPNVKVAWLQVEEDEDVPPVDLVFRDYPLRKIKPQRVPLSMVCPVETVAGKKAGTNCGTCGVCWKQ